jgi:hypothetical protein
MPPAVIADVGERTQRTFKLHDRTSDTSALDETERIAIKTR